MRGKSARILVAVALFTAACGGGDDATVSSAPAATTAVTTTVAATTVPTTQPPATTTTVTTLPPEEPSDAELLADALMGMFDNIDGIQTHYNLGVSGMSQTVPVLSGGLSAPSGSGVFLSAQARLGLFSIGSKVLAQRGPPPGAGPPANIPSGFRGPMGPGGNITAPSGACGAGAAAEASFETEGGDLVTPELLEEKEISNIDFDVLVGESEESLDAALNDLIRPGDPRLVTADGWNEAVWEPLAEMQEPADSLMDYHLWTVAEDVEGTVVDDIENRMETMGVPDRVMNAFEQSDRFGWFTNSVAGVEDRIAKEIVEAEFSGGIEGIVDMERDFIIEGAGELPEFSPMIGDGVVTVEHPELGPVDFVLSMEWTGWDELGRTTDGTMHFASEETGYEIILDVKEDGTKAGVVLLDGALVGNAELFVTEDGTFIEFDEVGE